MSDKAPVISVIIATKNAENYIVACLESIQKQYSDGFTEVIVADGSSDTTAEIIKNRFPWVRLYSCGSSTNSADLKGKAILESTGSIIAITEAWSVVGDKWIETIIKSHKAPYTVISGAVEPQAISKLRDWASYFSDYSAFIPPFAKERYNEMAGNNISYKRSEFSKYFREISKNGFWKAFIHSEMIKNNESMITDPQIVAYCAKKEPFLYSLKKKFHFGRCFGGMRSKEFSVIKKALYTILSPAIPIALFLRSAKNVLPKKRFVKEYILSSPWLMTLLVAWAFGEACGYIAGEGASCGKVNG